MDGLARSVRRWVRACRGEPDDVGCHLGGRVLTLQEQDFLWKYHNDGVLIHPYCVVIMLGVGWTVKPILKRVVTNLGVSAANGFGPPCPFELH